VYKPVEAPTEIRVLAVRYVSVQQNKTNEAFFFKKTGARYGRYYDREGKEVELRIQEPLLFEYEQVTELMNLTGRRHKGVDFKTDIGTPVFASFKAQILRRNWSTRRNGNCLEVRYMDSGFRAIFLHLDEINDVARPGRIVDAGTEIARSGNTGHSTAPHLHYQLHSPSGKMLNPFDVHKTKRVELKDKELTNYFRLRDAMTQLLTSEELTPESSQEPSGSNFSTARPK